MMRICVPNQQVPANGKNKECLLLPGCYLFIVVLTEPIYTSSGSSKHVFRNGIRPNRVRVFTPSCAHSQGLNQNEQFCKLKNVEMCHG